MVFILINKNLNKFKYRVYFKNKSPIEGGFRGVLFALLYFDDYLQSNQVVLMPRNKIIPYNPALKNLARKLRKESTLSEILLWKEIKAKQILGYQFHRQVPIDNYIVDFFCHELCLAIEIDGISHARKENYDEKRQKRLESLGVRFLRFDDLEVKFRMESVLSRIKNWINVYTQNKTSPLPPSTGD